MWCYGAAWTARVVCVSGRANVCVHDGVQGECVRPSLSPSPAYTLILFDRVVTLAPPGRPEMKSSPPAKPLLGALCSEAPWAAATPRSRNRFYGARRSEVMN